jgi:hypothetical protein
MVICNHKLPQEGGSYEDTFPKQYATNHPHRRGMALQLGSATRRKIEEITGMGLDQCEKWTERERERETDEVYKD